MNKKTKEVNIIKLLDTTVKRTRNQKLSVHNGYLSDNIDNMLRIYMFTL